MGSKRIRFYNNLQAGQLPHHEANNPSSQRYNNGLIQASGARFIGGRVTHANGTTQPSSHLFLSEFVPYPDGKTYIRNTDAAGADTVAALSADTSAGVIESLSDKLPRLVNAQAHLAKTGIADNNYNQTGKYNKFDIGLVDVGARLASSTGDVIYVSQDIRYCRAITYTDPTDIVQYWGLVGVRSFHRDEQHYTGGSRNFNRSRDDTGINPITIVQGKESVSDYTDLVADLGLTYRKFSAYIDISPKIYTIKKGWYKPTASVSLYLVGKMKMFSGSPRDPRQYSHHFPSIDDSNLHALDLNTNSVRQNQTGLDDVFILRWATGTEDQITYSLNDTDVQALDLAYGLTSQPPGAIAKTFYFSTARNKVVKLRRCGIAQFVDNTAGGLTNGERDFYVGFTALASAPGSGNTRVLGAAAGDPYLATLGKKPTWVEPAYQGVFAGTQDGEFLIANEQSQATFTIQKISSVGSGSDTTDYCDCSTSLYGNIYFITKRGIARLQFSQERNSFIPVITDTIDMGFAKPLSIASSKTLNCIIVFCQDGSWIQISPDTGAVSVVDFVAPSTDSALYSPVGVCTENGEVKFIWVSNSVYVQSFSYWRSSGTDNFEDNIFLVPLLNLYQDQQDLHINERFIWR